MLFHESVSWRRLASHWVPISLQSMHIGGDAYSGGSAGPASEPSITLSPYAFDAKGSNILHIAVELHNNELAQRILTNIRIDSARIQTMVNANGQIPLELAVERKFEDIIWTCVHDCPSIPWNVEGFTSKWKKIVEAATPEIREILHTPWREKQLSNIWAAYEGNRAQKRELEGKLRPCRWWPFSAYDAPWNDRERYTLDIAVRHAAKKGDREVLAWLVEGWSVSPVRVDSRAPANLLGRLRVADCAAHAAVQLDRAVTAALCPRACAPSADPELGSGVARCRY